MHIGDIRRLDGTLLLVFRETLARRKLTLVAERLNLTQPAVSHAVQRLREIFGDPLFVRSGAGMAPTALARSVAPQIENALSALGAALGEGRAFDPGATSRAFVIDSLDYTAALIGADLTTRLAQEAPAATVVFRSFDYATSRAAFEQGKLDLRIGVAAAGETGLIVDPLFDERFDVLARAGHPALADGLTLDQYCALDHVLVAAASQPKDSSLLRGAADAGLAAIGRRRRISMVLPQFLSAFVLVRDSDVLLTAPRKLARRYAGLLGLARHAPPFEMPGFQLSMMRAPASKDDPAINWLAGLCRDALMAE
ncbi:MAG: LysR family transcriptional regulator [Alphaproteobacteria bacterium]|nr:LysR family transcriptional regulator [Alphaproteobacteria bacterium]